MKKLKIVAVVLVVLLALLAVALTIVAANLGSIVKAGMQTVGPKVTQTTLTVDSVSISLASGAAAIKGLVLGNPAGYKLPTAISVGNAAVTLVPSSVLGDKVIIHSVEVRAPEITFEGNPFGSNNLTQIMANVNAFTASLTGTNQAAPAATSGTAAKPAKKLQVDDFLITGAKVHAQLTGLINKEITLPLPDIHLTNLGTGPDGITGPQLIKTVLSEVTSATVKAIGSAVTDLGKDAAAGAKSALHGASEGVDKIKKGLGGLFGK